MSKETKITTSKEIQMELKDFFEVIKELELGDNVNYKSQNRQRLENLFNTFKKFDIGLDLTSDLYDEQTMKEYEHTRYLLVNYLTRLMMIFKD